MNQQLSLFYGEFQHIVKPSVEIIPQEDVYASMGSTFTTICSDKVGRPRPSFYWMIDGVIINISGQFSKKLECIVIMKYFNVPCNTNDNSLIYA